MKHTFPKALALAALVVAVAASCAKKTASGPAATNTTAPEAKVIAPAPAPASGINQADADRATLKFPGTTVAMLEEGKVLYDGNCSKCHTLFAPKDFSEDGWRKWVPPMVKKARLDQSAEPKILAYVVTMRDKQ